MIRLYLLLTVILLSCSSYEPESKNGNLSIWVSYNDEEFKVFMEIVKKFESENNLKIEVQRIPFQGQEQKILTACAAHTTPDIARVDVAFVARLALRNAVIPLNIDDIKDKIVPAALKSNIINEKIYGIPDQTNCLCLFYNKDLFKQAGLNPNKPPKTWDEFIQYGKKLTNPAKQIYGFAMRSSLWWTFPFFNTFGAKFIVDGKCALDSPEGGAALQLKVDLYRKYKIEAGAWQSGAIDNDVGFQNGKYAMVFSGPWRVKTLESIGINFGVALIPAGPKGTSTTIGGTNMVIFRGSKHKDLALDFLKFLVNRENQAKWGNELGQIPVNIEAFADIDTVKYPFLKVFMEQMKTAIPRPMIPDYQMVENTVNPEIEAALRGTKTVKEALKAIVAKVNRILEEE